MPLLRIVYPASLVSAALLLAAFANPAPPSAQPPLPETAVSANTETYTGFLQERLRALPTDGTAYLRLGQAYLDRVRETADPSFYAKAEGVLHRAQEFGAEVASTSGALGQLALARHEFEEALDRSSHALAVNSDLTWAHGIRGDALVELGRYQEAFDAYQRMVDRRPDLASYSRVSHARELTGDVSGAIAAMRRAAAAGGATGEPAAWTATQLGNLLWMYRGDAEAAGQQYRSALERQPGYAPALAGLAKLAWARGEVGDAVELARGALRTLPSLEHAVLLSDLLHAAGVGEQAQVQDELVRAMERLLTASGVEPDAEQVLFEADRGDPLAAVDMAQGLYDRRPGPKTADVLAWALQRSGRPGDAQAYIPEMMSWGSRDPVARYHAAAIYLANGDHEAAAQHLNAIANPHFSPRYAAQAAQLQGAMQ